MKAFLTLAFAAAMLGVTPHAQRGTKELPVAFSVGERLEYDVSWSSYLTAGTVVLTVAEKRPSFGSTAYYITAEAQPTRLLSNLYTLYYKADTLIDVYTLLPQRGSIYSREGRRQRMKTTSFDHGAHKAKFHMQTASQMLLDLEVPPDTHDSLSALYALRNASLTPGQRVPVTVSDGGRLIRGDFAVVRREAIALPFGTVPALRIQPSLRGERGDAIGADAVLWLSDDTRRVPLRLDVPLTAGRFVLSLRRLPARG